MSPSNRNDNTLFPYRALGLFMVVLVAFMVVQTLVLQLPIMAQVGIIATQLVVILGGALIYKAKFAGDDIQWPTLGGLGMSPLALVAVLAASVALGFLANALGALTVYVLPGLAEMAEAYQSEIERLLLPETTGAQILGAVAVAVVAPVAEEYLFRGVILAEQRREQVAYSAILLNGILFSVMHLNPVAFVALTVVGCYFAHITLRSGSLWPAIGGHAVLNLVNGVVLIRLVEDVPAPDEIAVGELAVALAVLVPVAGFLWWLSIKLTGEAKVEIGPRPSDWTRSESADRESDADPVWQPPEKLADDRKSVRERPDADTDLGDEGSGESEW